MSWEDISAVIKENRKTSQNPMGVGNVVGLLEVNKSISKLIKQNNELETVIINQMLLLNDLFQKVEKLEKKLDKINGEKPQRLKVV